MEVSVQSLLITDANMQAQWSIRLPEAGARLPGAVPPPPLFSGAFDMPPSAQIMGGLGQYFQANAAGLVEGLNLRAEAAAKAEAVKAAPPAPVPVAVPVSTEANPTTPTPGVVLPS